MKKNCNDFLEDVLSAPGTDAEEHLRTCSACRKLNEDWMHLRTRKPEPTLDVPPALDSAILLKAAVAITERKHARIRHFFGICVPAAAALAVCSGILLWQPEAQEIRTDKPVATVADWTASGLESDLAVLSAEVDGSLKTMNLKGSELILAQLESDFSKL